MEKRLLKNWSLCVRSGLRDIHHLCLGLVFLDSSMWPSMVHQRQPLLPHYYDCHFGDLLASMSSEISTRFCRSVAFHHSNCQTAWPAKIACPGYSGRRLIAAEPIGGCATWPQRAVHSPGLLHSPIDLVVVCDAGSSTAAGEMKKTVNQGLWIIWIVCLKGYLLLLLWWLPWQYRAIKWRHLLLLF